MDKLKDERVAEDFWDRSAAWVVASLMSVAVISSVGIIASQLYLWLRSGTWIALPLVVLFEYLGMGLDPVYQPRDWQGVAKIARWLLDLPLSIALPAVLVAAAMGWKALVSAK